MIIPPEVWQCIGYHLSEQDLRSMMHVNSAFFHMYMKARYKRVEIWGSTQDREILGALNKPMLSVYVSHLRLCLSPAHTPSFKAFMDDLLATIRAMVNLTEISLKFYGHSEDTYEHLQQFFASLWDIIGNNLVSLEISGSLPEYDAYIPSHSLLPSLRKFVLNQDKAYFSSIDSKITALINGVASQLRYLEVGDNFHTIAPHLSTFPALKELKTSLWFADAEEVEIVKRFLTAQASLSEPFQLHLSTHSIFAEDVFTIFSSASTPLLPELVQLQSLSFQHTCIAVCSQAIETVIRTYCHSLRSLDFRACVFRSSARQLQGLVLAMSMCTQLSSLVLDVPKLDRWLLIQLSSGLPHLESLELRSYRFDLRLVGAWRKHSKLLRSQTLHRWKLHNLSIYYEKIPLDNKTMRQIAQLVPAIRSFWGTGDMCTPLPAPFMQWKHSHFMFVLMRSAAYRPLMAGVDQVLSRLPF